MTRRASLPGVDELFRSSRDTDQHADQGTNQQIDFEVPQPASASAPVSPPPVTPAEPAEAEPGRRPRHDEKVTFYCTASDLTRIERARLALRAEHRLASDRGRIVRAALAEILDDFERRGSESALVRRLREDRPQ